MERLNSKNTIETNEEEISEIKDIKKPIIEFAKLNKYFFILILCPIFCVINNFFGYLIGDKLIKRSELIYSIVNDLSYIFAGLFYFISYFRLNFNKNNKSSSYSKNNNSGVIYIYNEGIPYNYHPYKIIILIILLSLILGINDILYIFITNKNVFEVRIYILFFISFFSKIILKENTFKHQYFALIISISGIIFLIIPVCLKLTKEDIIPNIVNLIIGIMQSLFSVTIKYISEKYYISPIKIGLLIGIIKLFINFILYIIYSLIEFGDFSFFKDSFDFYPIENKVKISIYIILFILFYVAFNLFTLIALFYFSPTLIIITDLISPFLLWILIVVTIEGLNNYEDILFQIGFLIILFSSLIYNGIIIFNFCGLNKNTKKFVNQRINKELEEIKKNKDELLFENDDDSLNND